MSEPIAESQPYRPLSLIDIIPVPAEIEVPKDEEELVEVAKYIYNASPDALRKLPIQYSDLEKFFAEQYDICYTRRGIDIEPYSLDVIFQHYAVKKDEELGRNGFNTFGMAGISYLKALETFPEEARDIWGNRYFGALRPEKYRGKPKAAKALLMGCSSLFSVHEFAAFIKALSSKAQPVVADIDPLAVRLAKEAGVDAVQADAQGIPLEERSVDFIATNWLIPSLVDKKGSGKGAIVEVMKEFSRILQPVSGRLVMVEQLSSNDVEWLLYYASQAGLELKVDKRKIEAEIFRNRNGMGEFYDELPEWIARARDSIKYGESFDISSRWIGQDLTGIVSLVFGRSRWRT